MLEGKPKVVYVISTSHGAAMKNIKRVDTDGNAVQKPTSIIDYNHNMGGVDLVDLTARTAWMYLENHTNGIKNSF